jgi:predicted ester cyclase
VLIDGDTVAIGATLTGAYTGGFMGLPASGKPIRVPVAVIFRVTGGEISYERRVYDFTGMLVQIGVLDARPGL